MAPLDARQAGKFWKPGDEVCLLGKTGGSQPQLSTLSSFYLILCLMVSHT